MNRFDNPPSISPQRRRPHSPLFAVLFTCLFATVVVHAQTIDTAAGNGTASFSGDGGPAISASLNRPQGVAVDTAGNLYVVDTDNHRIRRVGRDGTISTVAGNGVAGLGGDGGPAIAASLNFPRAVAVDAGGNLFIADRNNSRIRKVQADGGTITTIAGSGAIGFSGDGGPAISASLNRPFGVAVDGTGNVFIADTGNSRIRRVAPDGTISTRAVFDGPFRVSADATGTLYVTDSINRISMVAADGRITVVAGNGTEGFSGDGGPATLAALASPDAVALDGMGNLYIVDSFNHRVRKVDASGTISTVIGNGIGGFGGDGGPALGASLAQPLGIAIDGLGNIYVGDFGNQRVRKVSAATLTPELATSGLIDYVTSQAGIKKSLANALTVKLDAVLAALAVPNLPLACQALADFTNLARAQSGKKQITAAQGDYMIAQASDIQLLMGCP